jgi:hypothetical protein
LNGNLKTNNGKLIEILIILQELCLAKQITKASNSCLQQRWYRRIKLKIEHNCYLITTIAP